MKGESALSVFNSRLALNRFACGVDTNAPVHEYQSGSVARRAYENSSAEGARGGTLSLGLRCASVLH